ncbi:hypothetical protein EL18_02156 [Nitratireductor basaltis]|uniref:Uncharacterized protein n=1 Tax=Nitratireductor basaltis TaxID=472175 RepID=A0A084UDS6_9HYPH|nr:hypothetical protein EL18_02156 [Nitratireductor basaltis]
MEYVAGLVLVQHFLKNSHESGTAGPKQRKRRGVLRLLRWLRIS